MNLPIKLELPDGFLEEEVRCDYFVSKQMKEVWAVELDLLNEFDRVCRENNITYYASMGTMLGAIRHNGYIPWDDDIDVMMFRDQYDKLCKLTKEFHEPYFFQTEYTDPGSLRGHAQLRNSSTTAIIRSEIERKINQGIFIDIFPVDFLPENKNERKEYIKKVLFTKKMLQTFKSYSLKYDFDSGNLKKILKTILYPLIWSLKKMCHIERLIYLYYEMLMKKYDNIHGNNVSIMIFLHEGKRVIWNISDFSGEPSYIPFEMFSIPVPSGYENILSTLYGNWHKAVKADSFHGKLLLDPRNSYTQYTHKRN